jgi:energy-coupling factor transporter ATP-binding protein EcfA2
VAHNKTIKFIKSKYWINFIIKMALHVDLDDLCLPELSLIEGDGNIVILLGETGSGKTTLASVATRGLSEGKTCLDSQTIDCQIYKGNGWIFVDTPGLNDSKGDTDSILEQITNMILTFSHVDLIIMTITIDRRWTESNRNMMELMQSMIGHTNVPVLIIQTNEIRNDLLNEFGNLIRTFMDNVEIDCYYDQNLENGFNSKPDKLLLNKILIKAKRFCKRTSTKNVRKVITRLEFQRRINEELMLDKHRFEEEIKLAKESQLSLKDQVTRKEVKISEIEEELKSLEFGYEKTINEKNNELENLSKKFNQEKKSKEISEETLSKMKEEFMMERKRMETELFEINKNKIIEQDNLRAQMESIIKSTNDKEIELNNLKTSLKLQQQHMIQLASMQMNPPTYAPVIIKQRHHPKQTHNYSDDDLTDDDEYDDDQYNDICGVMTTRGTPCKIARNSCRYH